MPGLRLDHSTGADAITVPDWVFASAVNACWAPTPLREAPRGDTVTLATVGTDGPSPGSSQASNARLASRLRAQRGGRSIAIPSSLRMRESPGERSIPGQHGPGNTRGGGVRNSGLRTS